MSNRTWRSLVPSRITTRLALAVMAAGALSTACDVHTVAAPGSLATITVTPNVTLSIFATQQFVAIGRDAEGQVVAISPIWTVEAGGGSIDGVGLFTAGTVPGAYSATVKAASGTISGTANVTVIVGPLATITVTPNPDTMAISETQQFAAVGQDAGGNIIAISPTWSVAAGGGAINSSGLFTAGTAPGSYANTVTATSGTITGSATVVVTAGPLATLTVTPNPQTLPINGTQQFVADGRDAANNVVAISPTWSVVAGGGAINGSGMFTAGTTPGTFTNTVRAASGAISGNATVVVTVGPVATIVVTPNPDTLDVLTTSQFTAVARDAANNIVVITPTWSVVAGGGSIDLNGLFTAGSAGGDFINTVQASSGAINGNATVVIIDPLLINFGGAASSGIMAGTAVSCSSAGTINADVTIWPGSTLSGFPPCVQTGLQHLGDAFAAQAQIDLTAAYDSLFALPCPPANVIVANLGGTTKTAGVYCSGSSIGVTGNLILDGGGDQNAQFVFQAISSLTTAGNVVLQNGAQAKNVYWVVGSDATIGTASQFIGNIVALTSISFIDSATLVGRALARNGAVSLTTANTITLP